MILIISRMIVPLIFTVIQTERPLLVLQGWKAFSEEALSSNPPLDERRLEKPQRWYLLALKTIITRSLPVLSHREERWRNGASETRGESLSLWSTLWVQIERRIVGWIIWTKLQKELNSSSEDRSTIYLPQHHTDKSWLTGLRTELQWPLRVISLPAWIEEYWIVNVSGLVFVLFRPLWGFQNTCRGAGGCVVSH